MNILKLNNISLTQGGNELFLSQSLVVNKGDKIALIGDNGSGKSSLLKLINKEITPNAGEINYDKKLNIVYLKQLDTEVIDPHLTIIDYLNSLSSEYWEITEIAETMFDLVIDDYDKPVSTLSGGQIMHINLALCFSKKPDLILLDEPTNHLDIISIKKLEKYLISSGLTMICVSHNQSFVENTCSEVWNINNKAIETFKGKLSDYRNFNAREDENREEKYNSEKNRLLKMIESQKTEQEKYEKGAKAKKAKYLEGSVDASQYGYLKSISNSTAGSKGKKFKENKLSKDENLRNLKTYG
jgi:ATPase subunit of ABC transporter with duplicated ATPase domains